MAFLNEKIERLNRTLYLDPGRDPGRSVLLLGSGRSGTTWLAEVLARAAGARLLFEPFHPRWCWHADDLRLFLDPAESDAGLHAITDRVLSGRLRDRQWADQIVVSRYPAGRVVKDIHAANLLPWLRANYPAVPVVYELRHPIATALSRRRVGGFQGLAAYLDTPAGRGDAEASPVAAWLPAFDEHRARTGSLAALVAEWCIENAYPLATLDRGGVELTYYEDAVIAPERELARVAAFCGGALGRLEPTDFNDESVHRPSAKDFLGTAAAAHANGNWSQIVSRWQSEVSDREVAECLKVLDDFGLGGLYGENPMPLKGDDVFA